MSEDRSDSAGPGPSDSRVVLLWGGGIVGFGVLAIALLYLFGDPRPRTVEAAQVGGGAAAVPGIVAGEDYFRIRAEFIPLPPASETTDPVGRAWAAMFGNSVARTGAAEIRLVFDRADGQPATKGGEETVLLAVQSDGPASSAVTSYFARREGTTARVRLDTIRRKEGIGGILPALHAVFGSPVDASGGWIPVVLQDTGAGADGTPSTLLAVRDFTGRAVAAVRLGVERRRSLVFGEEVLTATGSNPVLERLLLDNRTPGSMRTAIQPVLDSNLPAGFKASDRRQALSALLDELFAGQTAGDPAAACRAAFAGLTALGLSTRDAALLSFLAWPGTRGQAEGAGCGDENAEKALAAVGASAAAAAAAAVIDREEEALRVAAAKAKAEAEALKAKRDADARDACFGEGGARIETLCGILNRLAAEWRSGARLLDMDVSRRHILEQVGLEEPTLDMGYASAKIENRRQLLIHIAMSQVENFACFRLVHRDPAYVEALLVVRDNNKAERRLDVFQFAFNDSGKIVRIRRRAAVSQDLEAAKSLPATSRCRRDFLGKREAGLKKLIQRQWRLPTNAG